jgi:hypothetical protein
MIKGNILIYSNHTSRDVIFKKELNNMLGKNFITVFTREKVIGFLEKRITRDFLIEVIGDFDRNFYVCGPDSFVSDLSKSLVSLGASADSLVIEK